MSTDVLEGLDAPETEIEAPQPDVTEQKADTPEPEKAQGKAPDAKPAPKDEPKTIPLAAHLEERNKHRSEIEQTKAQLKALQDEIAKLRDPPKPAPAEPDFTADPKGYVDTRVKTVLEKLEGTTGELKKTAEQAQQDAGFTRFQHALQTTEHQFLSQNPDYYDALTHLRELRIAEITTLNPELTQEQVIQAMNREELQLAHQLMSAGRNPHQVAYQLAKARGYAKKEAAANGAAGAVLPNVPGPKQLAPDQTLGTGGGSPDASGETFLDDDEVFDKAFNEVFPRKRA